jgi:hypothetical protein
MQIVFRTNLHSSAHYGDQFKEDQMGGICNIHGNVRNSYNILVGNPDGKISLRKPMCRWEDNIKWFLRK